MSDYSHMGENYKELFDSEIDVAEIMREIKAKALAMQHPMEYGGENESHPSEILLNLQRVDAELDRIHTFIDSTISNSKAYIEMGATIPIGAKWKGIFRKIVLLLKRCVRKATRFLVEDQLKYNQMSSQNMRALLEGQQEIKAAISQIGLFLENCTCQKREVEEIIRQVDTIKAGNKNAMAQISSLSAAYQKHIEDNCIDEDLYAAFEERCRGSEDEIKKRLAFYIPYVTQNIRDKSQEMVLDLGCGRGEWLELLRESSFKARGVDLSDVMTEHCRDKGLDAVCEDAISYLKSLPDCSVKIITGFQFAEHLKNSVVQDLFKEAYRVLMFHGKFILEVPNPGNVEVGSANFYTDPTHVRPLTREYMEFMAKYHGFYEVETALWKQQEIDTWFNDILKDETTQALESPLFRTALDTIRNSYYSSPDYAMIATK